MVMVTHFGVITTNHTMVNAIRLRIGQQSLHDNLNNLGVTEAFLDEVLVKVQHGALSVSCGVVVGRQHLLVPKLTLRCLVELERQGRAVSLVQ